MPKERYTVGLPSKKAQDAAYDAVVSVHSLAKGSKDWKPYLSGTANEQSELLSLVKRRELKLEAGTVFHFSRSISQRSSLVLSDPSLNTFKRLGIAKDIAVGLRDHKAQRISLKLHGLDQSEAAAWVDAFASALRASEFVAPHYGSKPKALPYTPTLDIRGDDEAVAKSLAEVLKRSLAEADGTNLVRELAMLAANDLTPKNYANRIKKEAAKENLSFEFFGVKKLQQMKAGAFLAVVQASDEEDSGIVKLSYIPKTNKGRRKLVLVGKGITFDTGGTNIKGAAHMFGMHKDMAGSAVAYALVRLAAREGWDFPVTAYLAIADNLTGAKAYKPNDVVTAMSGRTIEIVHTDAEGRMVLADTLYLASKDQPDLIIDFATLTGACVGAIGNNYSGVFTNRPLYHTQIIESGKISGERVWPFPMDDDYGECLKSDTADTKQCRLTGGVDHIEAAIFLKSFLASDVPWVHVDLAAADHAGGLAHVDTEATGFGVRFAAELVRSWFKIIK